MSGREKRLGHLAAEIERIKKGRLEKTKTLYQQLQKRALFEGGVRTYEPYSQSGERAETIPPEETQVQLRVPSVLEVIAESESEILDRVYQQDLGNQQANADLVLADGTVIEEKVPVADLLYMRARLQEWRSIVAAIPVHNPAVDWTYDPNQQMYRTRNPGRRQRTAKRPEVITKAQPTREHPAQTEVFMADKPVGEYMEVLYSGCERADIKAAMLREADEMLGAVDSAIVTANMSVVVDQRKTIAGKLFGRLMSPLRNAYALSASA